MKRRGLIKVMILKVIAYIGIAFFVLCFLLFFMQKYIVFQPTREIETTPASVGWDFEDFYLECPDLVKIHAWFIPSVGKNTKTVLFCHENAGNISHRLYSLSIFRQLFCNILIFDYRGYGKSEGSPSEEGTYIDTETAYDWLVNKKGIPEKDIIVFGRSLGGAIAAEIATKRDPGGLILESTFTSVPEMAAKIYPFLPTKFLCRIKYDTISKMNKIKCPVLVIHSPQDEMIPFEMGKKIFEEANQPKYFLEISGGHNDGYFLSSQNYRETLAKFIFNKGERTN